MENKNKSSETAHTPGPWTAYPSEDGFNVYQDDGTGNGDHIQCISRTHPETLANARLIASAPELLAALEKTLAYMADRHPNGENSPTIQQARAAILKAKGGAL
jgi:hypothetical protein